MVYSCSLMAKESKRGGVVRKLSEWLGREVRFDVMDAVVMIVVVSVGTAIGFSLVFSFIISTFHK